MKGHKKNWVPLAPCPPTHYLLKPGGGVAYKDPAGRPPPPPPGHTTASLASKGKMSKCNSSNLSGKPASFCFPNCAHCPRLSVLRELWRGTSVQARERVREGGRERGGRQFWDYIMENTPKCHRASPEIRLNSCALIYELCAMLYVMLQPEEAKFAHPKFTSS